MFVSMLSGVLILIAGSELLPLNGSLLLWTALLVLPLALTTFYSVVLRTAHRIVSAQSYEQVLRPGLIIVGLAILSLGAVRLSPSSAMALTCAASFLTLLAVLLELRRVLRLPDRQRAHYGEWRRWLAVSLPLLIMGAVQELMNQVDIILLGQMADARQAAFFAASWRLASLVPFVLVGLATIAGPLIAAAHDRGAIEELHRVSRIVARTGLLFAVIGAIALFAFARPLLGLFGGEFVGAEDTLFALLFGGIANAFAGVVAYFMTLTGHERQALIIFAGALLISILLNVLLIPRFGALGAAVASSSATAAWNMMMLVYVRRTAGIDASALALPPRTRPGSGDSNPRDA